MSDYVYPPANRHPYTTGQPVRQSSGSRESLQSGGLQIRDASDTVSYHNSNSTYNAAHDFDRQSAKDQISDATNSNGPGPFDVKKLLAAIR